MQASTIIGTVSACADSSNTDLNFLDHVEMMVSKHSALRIQSLRWVSLVKGPVEHSGEDEVGNVPDYMTNKMKQASTFSTAWIKATNRLAISNDPLVLVQEDSHSLPK